MKLVEWLEFWARISFRMLRIRTVMVMVMFEAVGFQIVRPAKSLPLEFWLAAVMLGLLYMSATSFNDAADVEIDKVNLANDPSRPLVTTNVTAKQLKNLGVLSLVVAAYAALLIEPRFLLLYVAGILLSVLYSLPPTKISYRGIFAILWLPLSYVVVSFFAGAWIQHVPMTQEAWLILVAMYASFVGRIILKDFRDLEGDAKFGKRTFLIRHGAVVTCGVAAAAWLVGDGIVSWDLWAKDWPVVLLIQPMVGIILYGLYLLSQETKRPRKLLEVLFIGRVGNAVALCLLCVFSLRAFNYSSFENFSITAAVGLFTVFSAISLWYDDTFLKEVGIKK